MAFCGSCGCAFDASERRPKILTCGHTSCISCLGKEDRRRCPICNKVFKGLPSNLVDNLALMSMDYRMWCTECNVLALPACYEGHPLSPVLRLQKEAVAELAALRSERAAVLDRLEEEVRAERQQLQAEAGAGQGLGLAELRGMLAEAQRHPLRLLLGEPRPLQRALLALAERDLPGEPCQHDGEPAVKVEVADDKVRIMTEGKSSPSTTLTTASHVQADQTVTLEETDVTMHGENVNPKANLSLVSPDWDDGVTPNKRRKALVNGSATGVLVPPVKLVRFKEPSDHPSTSASTESKAPPTSIGKPRRKKKQVPLLSDPETFAIPSKIKKRPRAKSSSADFCRTGRSPDRLALKSTELDLSTEGSSKCGMRVPKKKSSTLEASSSRSLPLPKPKSINVDVNSSTARPSLRSLSEWFSSEDSADDIWERPTPKATYRGRKGQAPVKPRINTLFDSSFSSGEKSEDKESQRAKAPTNTPPKGDSIAADVKSSTVHPALESQLESCSGKPAGEGVECTSTPHQGSAAAKMEVAANAVLKKP